MGIILKREKFFELDSLSKCKGFVVGHDQFHKSRFRKIEGLYKTDSSDYRDQSVDLTIYTTRDDRLSLSLRSSIRNPK